MKKLLRFIGLALVVTQLVSCGNGPVIKYLKNINDEPSRYWIDFIKKNGVDAIDKDGDTILRYAVVRGDADLVKACIKSGADVNKRPNKKSDSTLILALGVDNYQIMEMLLKAKAEVRVPVGDKTADFLLGAINSKNTELVKLALKYYNRKQLDYRALFGLFNRNYTAEQVALMAKQGFKPHINDIEILVKKYQTFEVNFDKKLDKPTDKALYLDLLKKFVKDPYYVTNYPDNTILSNHFAWGEFVYDYELMQILFDCGYKPIITERASPATFVDVKMNEYLANAGFKQVTECIEFFIKNKIDFNTPMNKTKKFLLPGYFTFECTYLLDYFVFYAFDCSGWGYDYYGKLIFNESRKNNNTIKYQKAMDAIEYALSKGIQTVSKTKTVIPAIEKLGLEGRVKFAQ